MTRSRRHGPPLSPASQCRVACSCRAERRRHKGHRGAAPEVSKVGGVHGQQQDSRALACRFRCSESRGPDLRESCLRFGQDTYNRGGYAREPSRVGLGDARRGLPAGWINSTWSVSPLGVIWPAANSMRDDVVTVTSGVIEASACALTREPRPPNGPGRPVPQVTHLGTFSAVFAIRTLRMPPVSRGASNCTTRPS